MKFLYIVAAKSISDLALALIEMGHTVALVNGIEPDPINPDESHRAVIAEAIDKEKPDYVISYLFIPMVSEVTHSYGIPYISWTYDSPLTSLFCKELEYDNNYVFFFDKQECIRLKSLYKANIYYLPMAAYLTRVGAIDLKDDEISRFSSDISFIGTLYQENAYNSYIAYLDELTQLELKHYLITHLRNWSEPKSWPSLSEHAVKRAATATTAELYRIFFSFMRFRSYSYTTMLRPCLLAHSGRRHPSSYILHVSCRSPPAPGRQRSSPGPAAPKDSTRR